MLCALASADAGVTCLACIPDSWDAGEAFCLCARWVFGLCGALVRVPCGVGIGGGEVSRNT